MGFMKDEEVLGQIVVSSCILNGPFIPEGEPVIISQLVHESTHYFRENVG